MDDSPMDHTLDASALAGGDINALAVAKQMPSSSIPWDTYLRCLFLSLIVALTGYMAWTPVLFRFSVLLSQVSPSHGDSLNWRPSEDATVFLQPAKRTPPTPEWRLKSTHSASWIMQRSDAEALPSWRSGSLSGNRWRRSSHNPWSWRDDHQAGPRRKPELAGAPVQKPPASFRSADWQTETAAPLPGQPAEQENTLSVPSLPQALPESIGAAATTPSSLPPLQIPALTPLGTATPPLDVPMLSASGPELDEAEKEAEKPAVPTAPAISQQFPELPTVSTVDEPLRPSESVPPAAGPSVSMDAPGVATQPAPAFTEQAAEETAAADPLSPAVSSVQSPGVTDWLNNEITGPIPGAFLTIYPKLRFVGLCVPDQGYIRKYYQVAVPEDLTGSKMSGQDGRTPYGRYYVAARAAGGDGASLYLSWPSPEDARRIGLDAVQSAAVASAWAAHTLPPQNTPAGGGVSISVQRGSVDVTTGGFRLELPQMEELSTALPDGAWVFIQE